MSDDEEDELLTEDVRYKFEGETLVLTDGTFTKEHTVELSKDRLVLKYTSEITTEEMPWREMTEYFRRIE